jgi:CHAT domain-containing protein/tetratricopeptide (TPR) repeat protein
MVNSHPTGCLEPEVVAAYVDHGLSLAERAQVETHLASCRECTALLAGVVRTVADVSAFIADTGVTEATPFRTRRTALVTLGAAAAVFAVLVVPPFVRPWLERDAGLVSLVDSVGEQRSVLGRLTGGFPHAPLRVSSAGGQDGQAAETDRVLLTAGRIRESFGELATPSRLHALGVSQLLAGRHDDAVQSLLAASREQPANAQYLSDVAAVQLERARLGLRPDDLPRALAAADRARRLDPSLNEAWFNRALAVSALSMTDQARTAWTEYLKRDSVSPWATEARARLEELARPTAADAWAAMEGRLAQSVDTDSADAAVRAQTTNARKFTERLFLEWANAVISGGTGEAALERARTMSQAMLRVAGDALYADVITAIGRLESASAIRRFADAQKLFAAGSELFDQDRFSEASQALTSAREQLRATANPFATVAAVHLAAIRFIEGQYPAADAALDAAHDEAVSRNYLYASARALWFRGLLAFAQGRLAEAQSFYDDTLATFERMGDVEQMSAAHGLLSGVHFVLGDHAAEWQHRQRALEGLQVSSSPRFRYSLLVSAAISIRVANPEAALVMFEEVIAEARRSKRDAAIVDALAQRAATLNVLGRGSEADQALIESRSQLAGIRDESFRRLFELPVLAVESDMLRATSPQLAAAAAQRALDTVVARGDRSRLPQFQLRLAKANIAWGRLEEAERALVAGIQAFDEQRATLTAENAISATDESWQLFETAQRLAIRRGDYPRAFAMAERARATSLAEQRKSAIPTLANAQLATRGDEAIVALNQFEDELAIWVIRNQSTTVLTRPIDRLDAQRIIARHQQEIQFEASRSVAGADLFDTIMRPLSRHLDGVTRVVFIPDATYQNVSFAALWDKSKGRFLVEQLRLSTAPSVASLAASAAVPRATDTSDRAMIVSADAADAAAVASQYRVPAIVSGPSATRARFLADAPSSTIVHLAVPAHANAMYPLLSRLEFNDEPGQRYSGSVLGSDIASREMPSTRIVVLDEIRRSQQYRTVGTFSLARAFLAAGVPAVLGTLPGADESATRGLMAGFHREMAAQASAEEALTRVQRNALQQNGRRLGAWTALVLYGSDR